jgi:hypothetical protein
MKILSCKLRYLSSIVRPLKITWRVRLSDGRVVKVIDYRDIDDFRTDWTAEGLDWDDDHLVDELYDITDLADYTLYEV